MPETYRIGVDVGGTNTDAVILDSSGQVVAKYKSPTTSDVESGVRSALHSVLLRAGLDPGSIRFAMLSTTHCTNAIITRQGLVRIGVIRLGAPATTSIPPLTTWPADLRDKILVAHHVLTGGHEFTGEEIAPLDEWGIRNAARAMKGQVDAVAVSGVFSPVNAAHELRARVILREEMGAEIPSASRPKSEL